MTPFPAGAVKRLLFACIITSVFLIFIVARELFGHFYRAPITAVEHKVYRVLDVGKPGVPVLSKEQLDWLHKIEKSPYYSKHIAELYFSPEPAINNPLIVFHGGLHYDENVWSESWVIGDPCNDMFHGKNNGEEPIMENECGPPV